MALAARRRRKLDPAKIGGLAEKLETDLRARIVGQEQAIDEVINGYQTYLAQMNPPGRPIANYLFLGPTGTGKTRAVEATAESLLGDQRAVVKIDCAEFQHSHEIAKLIGSPPGYLGHRETHPLLSQEALSQYYTEELKISFVLFDEIEKASDALWNLLLGILDKATLTLGDNRRVDFSRAMIFMTSNLGASEMSKIMSPGVGFANHAMTKSAGVDAEKVDARLKSAGVAAARRKFTPEFMNRIDKIVVFKALGETEIRRILDLELKRVQERILGGTPFLFQASESAKEALLQTGVDEKYGARHLKREIERGIVRPMANLIATDQARVGDLIEVGFDDDAEQFTFERVDEGVPTMTMYRIAGIPIPPEDDLKLVVAGD